MKKRGNQILAALGNPPKIENITPEIWEELGAEMTSGMFPLSERTFVRAQQQAYSKAPIGVDCSLVNQRAIDWVRDVYNRMVKDIAKTDRDALQSAVLHTSRIPDERRIEYKSKRYIRPARAETIAVTEVTRASSEGERAAKELATQVSR